MHGSDKFDNIQAIQASPVVDGGVLLRVSAVRTRIVAGMLLAGRAGSVAGLKTLIFEFSDFRASWIRYLDNIEPDGSDICICHTFRWLIFQELG